MGVSEDLGEQLETVALSDGRIYRNRLPDPFTLPAITFQRMLTGFQYAHDGDLDLTASSWQITCWAVREDVAEELLGQVKIVLDNWAGAVVLPEDWRDFTDPDTGLSTSELDVVIWYSH